MEDIINDNNQAGRLYKILSKAAKLPDNIPTIDVWANVFQVNSEEKTIIFYRYISLQETSDNIRNTINNMVGVNSQLLLSQHQKIDKVLKATNLDTHWVNYKKFLTETVLINLAHCAEALSQYDEKQIDNDMLSELTADISKLFDKISTSNVDSEFKTIIQDLLEALRRSIAEYNIRGAKGIRENLAYCYGKVFQNHATFKQQEGSDEVNSLWKILSRVDNLTTVALNLASIGTTAINLLAICNK
ncbi:MAG: hypothetical protein PHH28_12950 [Desulfuromonadaceae bacterium]|nr:hypothetical protein [Desulfuromonadaceae bacterium]